MSAKPVRLLLIEEDPEDAQRVESALSRAETHFEVQWVNRLSEALDRLGGGRFDAVIADLAFPNSSKLDTVTRIRQRAINVPIVVLTGLADNDAALVSLDLGGQDYLIKDRITPEVIDRAVRYAIQRQHNADMRRLLDQVRASEKLLAKKHRRLARLYKTAHHSVDNVSHEFRTPLAVITEYVSLLRDGVVGPINKEQCRMLDVVADRSDDLNNMVDDMLDVSKLKAGMLSVNRGSCHVSKIINHIRVSLDRKAAIRKAQFSVAIEESLPEVYCDAHKVARVIVNLVVNAIKFCGEPGNVQLWARSDPGSSQAVIGVTDNGAGIEHEHLAKIFRRFKQLETQPSGGTRGFGLGLAIAKQLVDLNLGRLMVESQKDMGSTFSFTLPLANPCSVMPRYLNRLRRRRNGPSVVSLVTAFVHDSTPKDLANDVHAFLTYLLRSNDLLFRADTHAWAVVLPGDQDAVRRFTARLTRIRREANRNRPHGHLPEICLQHEMSLPIDDQSEEILTRTIAAAGHGVGSR